MLFQAGAPIPAREETITLTTGEPVQIQGTAFRAIWIPRGNTGIARQAPGYGIWKDVTMKVPDNPRGHLNLAEAWKSGGFYREAFAEYQMAMATASKEHTWEGLDLLAHAEANMGTMLLSMPDAAPGDMRIGEQALRASLSIWPYNADASVTLADVLNRRGQFFDALTIAEDALRYPSAGFTVQQGYLHFQKGAALCGLHRLDLANVEFHKAAAAGPDIPEAVCAAKGTD